MKNVRVWFKKDGSARYISHLDLNRCMTRVLQRSKIPIWYTEGFNPHPFLTFALPLSLGVRGERESMDIKLLEDLNKEETIKRLNDCLPNGIEVFDVTDPIMKPGRISYALFNMKIWAEDMSSFELVKEIKSVINMPEIMVDKRSKSGIKEVDLKENICKYDIFNDINFVNFKVLLPAGSVTNVNPSLILDAIEKYRGIKTFADITRLDLYNEQVERFI